MGNERAIFFKVVEEEVERVYRKHGRDLWGRHEFYGIIKEEVDEMWDAIKTNKSDDSLAAEIIQVAAMCLRFLETGDRYAKDIERPSLIKKIYD
jgi:hypothetical protein